MATRVRTLESKQVYNGKIFGVKVDRVIEPGNVTATRELVTHSGSVVVCPRLDDGRVVLVRQFRYAAGKSLWELVAGSISGAESPLRAAHRELLEETGYSARRMKLLFRFYPSPGFLTERLYLYEATGLTSKKAQPEEDERIKVRIFSMADIRSILPRLEDAKTLVGALWLLGGGNQPRKLTSKRS
jgi:ADP-ribose pyrophosphatase